MSILFVNENNITSLKQTLYFLIARDRKTIDDILNSLMRQDQLQKISLKIILLIALLTFVVWKNDKSRIVIDFRKINTWLYLDAYSLLRQNTIFGALEKVMIFSFINLIKSFF